MEKEKAKEAIYIATEDGAYVDRCNNKTYVRLAGQECTESIYFEALEELHRDGKLVQVPSSGQSRSSVSFRRADHSNDVKQLK